MDWGISQGGCFDRTIIVQRAVPASGTGSTALPCRMSPTNSLLPQGGHSHVRARGRNLWCKEARLCRGKCRYAALDWIPIFLWSCRKENGHSWSKEKTLRDELTDGAANSPKTGTGRHELPTELETPLPAALYLNLKSVRRRICGHGAQRGANRTPSASLSAAAPPSNSGRGFQRGGTAVPPLCAPRGHGGLVASPMFRVGV